MADKLNSVLDRIEEQPRVWLEPDENSLDLCRKIYRNNSLPLPTRMRAAMAALPHEVPKLGVSMNVNLGDDFASRLEAAIARTNGAKVIEHQAAKVEAAKVQGEAEEISASKMQRPMLPLRRRI